MPLYNPAPSCVVLAQSAVAVPLTGSTSKTTLATISVPAGAMKANSALRVTMFFSATNNANVKTGTLDLATWTASLSMAAAASGQVVFILRNRGAVNNQVAHGSINLTTTSAPGTYAIDFSAAQSLVLSGTLAVGTDTITLEGYTVEVLN